MSFDLYFAGLGPGYCVDLLIDNNANRLFSQLNDRGPIKKHLDAQETRDWKGKLFIDSGAFSAHTKGSEVDVDDYINYINEHDDSFSIYAQVDKIPGVFGKPKSDAERAEAPKLSWENYLYMKDRVKSRDKLIPVFHQGEDFKWLKNMLEYTHEDGSHIKYIGISPANDVDVNAKIPWIEKCFDEIKRSSNPEVKTHAFGMTTLSVLEKFPFTSADSTTWVQVAAYGGIITPWGVVRMSPAMKKQKDHYCHMPKPAQQYIEEFANSHGISMEDLQQDKAWYRAALNALYLMDWAKNYTYKPARKFKGGLIK